MKKLNNNYKNLLKNFEKFLAEQCWDLNEYRNTEDKIRYIKDNIKDKMTSLDETTFNQLLHIFNNFYHFQLYSNGFNGESLNISYPQFRDNVSWNNLINTASKYLEEKISFIKKTEQEAIESEIQRKSNYSNHEKKQKHALKYFNETLPYKMTFLEKYNNKNDIRKYYKKLVKEINNKIYLAYLPNTYAKDFRPMNNCVDKMRSQYLLKLRIKVIEKLKVVNKFNPYKDIVRKITDVRLGYHHHASVEIKDFLDEWDLYYLEKPSIHKALNNKANFTLQEQKGFSTPEFLFLFPKVNLTKFGFDHLYDVIDELDILINKKENEINQTLLYHFSLKYKSKNSRYLLDNHQIIPDKSLKEYWLFYDMSKFSKLIYELTRDAENTVRERSNIPKVNEGWINETKLYYKIKNYFQDVKVIHHARIDFLGRQHLDIFIPNLKVGIEYQGLQHDEPVDFFGGKESFEQTRIRDANKYRLCKEHGIRIVYVREGYQIEKVLDEIISK